MLKLNSQIETIETPEAGSSSAPLFLIHDGSGICAHYHRLQSLNRPVYALHDPKFLDTFDTWSDLSQMAEHYAQVIESIASGPLLVGGWSFGGVVAYEVSRHLSLRGHTIVGTVLIDAPPPLNHQPLSPAIIDAVMTAQGSGYKQPAGSEAAKAIRYFVRRSFTSCANLLGAFHPQNTLPAASTSPVVLLRSREGWHHPSNSTPLTEHHWLQNRDDPREAVAGWETITGRSIPWVDIPGNHFEVFDAANIEAVSEAVCCAVRELETTLS
jgi:thioesterase domain-containing protein